MIRFTIPPRFVNPEKKEDILFVANRLAAIRWGDSHIQTPAEIGSDGTVNINPGTNDHWLVPPKKGDDSGGTWRLNARYDSDEKLEIIVSALKAFI